MMIKLYAAVIFVISSSVIQQTWGRSSRQYRILNKNVALLRTSLLSEMDTLKFEMLELKDELKEEKAKTARLESMLTDTAFEERKQTDFLADGTDSGDAITEQPKYVKNERKTVMKRGDEANSFKRLAKQAGTMVDIIYDTREVTQQHELRLKDIEQHIIYVKTKLKLSAKSARDIKEEFDELTEKFYAKIDTVKAYFNEFAKITKKSLLEEKEERIAFQKNISLVFEMMSNGISDTTEMTTISSSQRFNDSEENIENAMEETLTNRTKCLDKSEGALGMESGAIPDSAISASSMYAESTGPDIGRIRNEKQAGSWCPASTEPSEYLQIDLGVLTLVTQVETQGRFGNGQGKEYVKTFRLEYQNEDGDKWLKYTNAEGETVMEGNTNTYIAKLNTLYPPVVAKRVRFYPVSWHMVNCMRVEIYGCKLDG